MKVCNLQCEAMKNPLGISIISPRLSWAIESEERNVYQVSYHITVWDEYRGNKKVVFDSGEKICSDSFAVLPEIFTDSGRRYFWSVSIKDNHGNRQRSKEHVWFETGLLQKEDWKAKWIEPVQADVFEDVRPNLGWNEPKQSKEILEDQMNPCQMLRNEFEVRGKIIRARAYATAHGIYRLIFNGKRAGNYEFAPEATPYQAMLQVQTYDITELLKEGTNVVGAVLANGWWAGRIGHYGESCQYGNRLALLMQIIIEYDDGSIEVIGTDETYRSSEGPRRYAELGIGEKYDMNFETEGWDIFGYLAEDWIPVQVKDYGYDNLTGQNAQHIRALDVLDNPREYCSPRGEKILDFGQVIAGKAQMHISAAPYATVKLRYFEETDADGNYWFELDGRNSQQMDTVVLDKTGEVNYDPWFTYHAFRYIYIDCDNGDAAVTDARASLIASDVEVTASIQTSDERVNRLQDNIRWTLRSNMTSVLTDNPDRERAGWTGDLQMISPTLFYNVDAQAFVRRWMKEAEAEQRDDGSLPLVVPNWPHYQQMPMLTSAGWGDVCVIVPWLMYERYGDKRILKECWPMMQKWLGFIRTRARKNPSDISGLTPERAERLKYLWNADFNYGDWLTPSACYNEKTGEYTYFTQTLCYMMGTYYYAYSSSIMAKTAEVLGLEKERIYYSTLTEKIREAAIEEIYKTGGILESEFMGAQILALHMGFYPEEEKENLVSRLTELFRQRGMDAGFSSALLISDTFCENGYPEMAYDILLNDKFPSWLYEVEHGATSVWESMQAIMPDGTRNAVSYIQPAFCSIGNWMMQGMGGIRPGSPGFRKIVIHPYFTDRLTYVDAQYASVQGKIRCKWEHTADTVRMDVEIPANTTAEVLLPFAAETDVKESGKLLTDADGICEIVTENGNVRLKIKSGKYQFEYRKNKK